MEALKGSRMCPKCGGDSYVWRAAEREDGLFVRRRRCKSCGIEFETLEVFTGCTRYPKRKNARTAQKGSERDCQTWIFTGTSARN